MTSKNPQDENRQLNYSDHLRRVRQVKRTLDVATPNVQTVHSADGAGAPQFLNRPESAIESNRADANLARESSGDPKKMKPVGRDHISHESLRDQAVSRKTRRPAEDVDIAKALLNAETPAGHPEGSMQQPQFHPQVISPDSAKLPTSTSSAVEPVEKPMAEAASQKPPQNPPSSSVGTEPIEKEAVGRGSSRQFVAKTLMDHNAILKAQALRQKARIEKELAERQKQPVKLVEPIKAQKEVRSCPFSWTEDISGERFRYCSKCQAPVYNLDGLDFAEAEKLIFKRENRKKFVIFRRPDGKFMTSDCPVEKRKRQQFVGAIALCVCLVIVVVSVLIMMPPSTSVSSDNLFEAPAPDPVSSSNWSEDPPVSGTKSTATKSGEGIQHYEAGDVLPKEPASSGIDTSKPAPKAVTESEENGDFWEFGP